MLGIGILLLVVGLVLLVAEAHVPSGAFGVAGAAALAGGAALVVAGAGGVPAVAVPIGVGVGAATGLALLVAGRKALSAQRSVVASGRESLVGRYGTVRSWSDSSGLVFVDGALWRACRDWEDPDEEIHEGDPVLVERVGGLTLSVRKAYPWELTT